MTDRWTNYKKCMFFYGAEIVPCKFYARLFLYAFYARLFLVEKVGNNVGKKVEKIVGKKVGKKVEK